MRALPDLVIQGLQVLPEWVNAEQAPKLVLQELGAYVLEKCYLLRKLLVMELMIIVME